MKTTTDSTNGHDSSATLDTDSMNSRTSRIRSLPIRTRFVGALAFAVVLLLLLTLDATGLAAQQGPGASLGQQSLRPYAHVFWAYGLAWALVLGWVVSISRRWSRVEDDLERRSGSE